MGKITLEQAIQILNLILKADVTGEAVQKTLIERFDLIKTMMKYPEVVRAMDTGLFEAFILSNVPPLRALLEEAQAEGGEGIVSEYGYPAGWCLKSMDEQLMILKDIFPDLAFEAEIPASLPEGAEGWLVVPKPSKIAKTYNEALETLLSLLGGVRSAFSNWRQGKLGPEYLQITEKTRGVLDRLERSTTGDYLVLAIQCGLRYQASSVFQARKTFDEKEYGLGPFEIAGLLLTHPERLADYEHLGIDCPGGEYAPNADRNFSHSLYFIWDQGGLYFDCSYADGIGPGFGSASGFL